MTTSCCTCYHQTLCPNRYIEAISSSFWKISLESHVFFNFWTLYLFLGNGLQALYVNSSPLKYMSDMNVSSSNKSLFIVLFIIFILHAYKIVPIRGIFLKGKLGPSNKPLAPCSLLNFDFLLLQTAQFYDTIIPQFFCFYNFWVFIVSIFLHFKQQDNTVLALD